MRKCNGRERKGKRVNMAVASFPVTSFSVTLLFPLSLRHHPRNVIPHGSPRILLLRTPPRSSRIRTGLSFLPLLLVLLDMNPFRNQSFVVFRFKVKILTFCQSIEWPCSKIWSEITECFYGSNIFAFNSHHNRLQFTIEHEINHCISFLDLSLIRTGDKLITDWFQKNTFSGRYLSYYSCYPLGHKVSIVYISWWIEQFCSPIRISIRKILNWLLTYYWTMIFL